MAITRHIAAALTMNNNIFGARRLAMAGEGGDSSETLADATMSDRLKRLALQGYIQGGSRGLERILLEALNGLPPDRHGIHAIIDGHQEEYFFESGRHGPECPPTCRHFYKRKAHSDNKRSPFAHEWIVVALAWRSGKRSIVLPARVVPILGAGHEPVRQVQVAVDCFKRLGIRPSYVLVDSAYDAADVRRLTASTGIRLLVRMRQDPRSPRVMYDARTGHRATMDGLLHEAVATGRVHWWRDPRMGTTRIDRQIVRQVRGEVSCFAPVGGGAGEPPWQPNS